MADTAGLSREDAAAARAAEQARIRKERREAKIKAGGSARLNKITGLGGGLQRDPVPPQPSAATASSPATTPQPASSTEQQHHGDPDEVDISNAEHYYAPQTTNRIPRDPSTLDDNQLRQMMLGFDPTPTTSTNGGATSPPTDPFAAMMGGAGGPDPNDPMMKMLSQMMGAGAGGPGGPGGPQNPFAAMAGGQQQPPAQQAQPADASAAIWRVLHFLVAVGLGLYIVLLTRFTGTKVERERSAFAAYTVTSAGAASSAADADGGSSLSNNDNIDDLRKYFFWAFATAESVLLTTRFFLDKGARGSSGIVAMVLGFVPEGKGKSLVVNGLRYAQVFSTVRMDMLVCVFVLGVCSLMRG